MPGATARSRTNPGDDPNTPYADEGDHWEMQATDGLNTRIWSATRSPYWVLASRLVRLAFAGAGDALRAARGVSVRVPASSTIRASRLRLRGAGRVRFSGRLRTAGEAVPRRGLLVILQGRERGRWRTFEDVRTDHSGRWRASYRFRGIRGTFPIRARLRK